MMDDREIKARILHKLARRRMWGGKHTSFDNTAKGFPAHIQKDVKRVGALLIKEGLLTPKQTIDDLHIRLNPRMHKEIIQIIENYFKKEF